MIVAPPKPKGLSVPEASSAPSSAKAVPVAKSVDVPVAKFSDPVKVLTRNQPLIATSIVVSSPLAEVRLSFDYRRRPEGIIIFWTGH